MDPIPPEPTLDDYDTDWHAASAAREKRHAAARDAAQNLLIKHLLRETEANDKDILAAHAFLTWRKGAHLRA